MSGLLVGLALFLGGLIAVNLYRVAAGPTVYDRLLAVSVIGTKSILLLVLVGSVFERVDFFLDLAIVYALLGFVGVLAAGKYLEPRPSEVSAPDGTSGAAPVPEAAAGSPAGAGAPEGQGPR